MAQQSGGQRHRLIVAIAVMVTVIIVDQLTKSLAVSRLELGHPIHVIGTLRWELVYNRGSAFGKGDGFGPVIGIFAIVIAAVLLVAATRAPKSHYAMVYGLVAGGAIGNVIDRLFRTGDCPGQPCTGFMGGAVIDFINVSRYWWVFNVADMAIVVGVATIAFAAIFFERRGTE